MRQHLAWSWRALLAAWLICGVTIVSSTYIVDLQRTGLDADSVFLWASWTPLDSLGGMAQMGFIGVAFVSAGFWLSRLLRLGPAGFVLLTSFPVTVAMLWMGLEPTTLVDNHLFCTPTWLTPFSLDCSLAAGALGYLITARSLKAR